MQRFQLFLDDKTLNSSFEPAEPTNENYLLESPWDRRGYAMFNIKIIKEIYQEDDPSLKCRNYKENEFEQVRVQ